MYDEKKGPGPPRYADGTRTKNGYARRGSSNTTRAVDATWGEKPASEEPRGLALKEWRRVVKGALRGFATVELPNGLTIIDCPVFSSNGKTWATFPSRPVLDQNGQHTKLDNGKPQYAAILKWPNRDLTDRFSAAVVALVRRVQPDALS
jgi:hypothetical protein